MSSIGTLTLSHDGDEVRYGFVIANNASEGDDYALKINFSFSDGINDAVVATASIDVDSTNDAPVLGEVEMPLPMNADERASFSRHLGPADNLADADYDDRNFANGKLSSTDADDDAHNEAEDAGAGFIDKLYGAVLKSSPKEEQADDSTGTAASQLTEAQAVLRATELDAEQFIGEDHYGALTEAPFQTYTLYQLMTVARLGLTAEQVGIINNDIGSVLLASKQDGSDQGGLIEALRTLSGISTEGMESSLSSNARLTLLTHLNFSKEGAKDFITQALDIARRGFDWSKVHTTANLTQEQIDICREYIEGDYLSAVAKNIVQVVSGVDIDDIDYNNIMQVWQAATKIGDSVESIAKLISDISRLNFAEAQTEILFDTVLLERDESGTIVGEKDDEGNIIAGDQALTLEEFMALMDAEKGVSGEITRAQVLDENGEIVKAGFGENSWQIGLKEFADLLKTSDNNYDNYLGKTVGVLERFEGAGNVTTEVIAACDGKAESSTTASQLNAQYRVVQGKYGTLFLNVDTGDYYYTATETFDNNNQIATYNEDFVFYVKDEHGSWHSREANVTLDADHGETVTGDDSKVYEVGLDKGSTPGSEKTPVRDEGSIDITAPDGVDTITLKDIKGKVVTIVEGGKAVEGATVSTDEGEFSDFAFDKGTLSYTFTLNDNTLEHEENDPSGKPINNGANEISHDLELIVTDTDGDKASATLSVTIVDDVPQVTVKKDDDADKIVKLYVSEEDLVSSSLKVAQGSLHVVDGELAANGVINIGTDIASITINGTKPTQ